MRLPRTPVPIADLLRLNTGIPPTPVGSQKRLGFLAGDLAGFPQGRRPIDDVVDIASRAVAGILVDPMKYGAALGDGVNTKKDGFARPSLTFFLPTAAATVTTQVPADRLQWSTRWHLPGKVTSIRGRHPQRRPQFFQQTRKT